ncbi:MAG: HAD-IA family hydrolase, partial [Raoultibacter sp.]
AAHLRLGIVSNWSPNLTSLMRGLQFAPYFEEIISSADVGYRKPNPLIFTLILERMGLSPDKALHVGDRPDADGAGAAAAGIEPIIVDRHGKYTDCDYTRITSLAELPDLIMRRK